MELNNKQRAYLSGLAANEASILSIGKSSLTPEVCASVDEALEKRELIKISVQKNCTDDIKELANILSERTRSVIVRVIGRRIILYRPSGNKKIKRIELPK